MAVADWQSPVVIETDTTPPARAFAQYAPSPELAPLLLRGDALSVLRSLPGESIDCAMTSPPYWGKRQYADGGIGLEEDYGEYVSTLLAIFAELKRVLKSTGSFWLNVGDAYREKSLLNIPWRIAIAMTDQQGWVQRNTAIWNKVKGGPDNSIDKLRNIYEPLFHFTKSRRGYYYDVDAIRATPRKAKVNNGSIVSATGVSGVRYKRQIELSTALTDQEKVEAQAELDRMIAALRSGAISDFRMIIRGQQRTTHSDAERVSGRAKEIAARGFYFLKYHPNGVKPSDVWEVIPEDTQAREAHFAPYPEDLCKLPIIATCPAGGVVLDPFAGTGTTLYVARTLGRKSVGVDISDRYLQLAAERCNLPS